jgi:hypothetical protein
MAKTMTPGMALDLFAVRAPRILTDGWGARFCDSAHGDIWERYPWPETLAGLTPFYLVYDLQGYGAPTISIPSDFDYLHEAYLANSNRQIRELKVQRHLPTTDMSGFPTTIMYKEGQFLLHPRSSVSQPDWWVGGTYKKTPTKITNANLNSYTLPWEDKHFDVFRQGVEWRVKQYLGDRDWMASRQLFELLLEDMAVGEGLAAGPYVVSPSESLELGG